MAMVGAIGALASGAMGMIQANYQAQVAQMNAKIAKDNAHLASTRGGIEAPSSIYAELLGAFRISVRSSSMFFNGNGVNWIFWLSGIVIK